MWAQDSVLDEIYLYLEACTLPKEQLPQYVQPFSDRIQQELRKGNIGLTALFNACLTEMYRLLSPQGEENDEYLELFLIQLNAQVDYYRVMNDEYQVQRTLEIIRKELSHIQDDSLRQAIEGYTDCKEGTFIYRKGEYVRLVEMYLRDDLDIGRKRFDNIFPDARYASLKLLKDGERKLNEAIDFWEKQLPQISEASVSNQTEEHIKRHRRHVGETRFRLGE